MGHLGVVSIHVDKFGPIKHADFDVDLNYPTLIIGKNATGKTHLMFLLYLYFFLSHAPETPPLSKLKGIFLLGKRKSIANEFGDTRFSISGPYGELHLKNGKLLYTHSGASAYPLYLSLPAIGEYYMGSYAAMRYYPGWNIIPDPVKDFLTDIFLSEANGGGPSQFPIKAYVQKNKVMVKVEDRTLPIERVASGYKALSWLFLALRIAPDVLLFDDIEATLHPSLLHWAVRYLIENFKGGLIVSTHSDLTVEILNSMLMSGNIRQVNVVHTTVDGTEFVQAQVDKLIPSYLSEEYEKLFYSKWGESLGNS